MTPIGTGARFRGLAATLATKPGVRDPQAPASVIGRKKLGKAKFNTLSHRKPSY